MTAQDTAVAEAIRKRQGRGLGLPLLLTGAVAVQLATAGQEQLRISNGVGGLGVGENEDTGAHQKNHRSRGSSEWLSKVRFSQVAPQSRLISE